jgi:hypothetical protein
MSANPTDGLESLDSSSKSGSRPVRSKHTSRELLDADHMRTFAITHAVWSGLARPGRQLRRRRYYYCRGPRLSRRLMLRATMIRTVTRTCLPRVSCTPAVLDLLHRGSGYPPALRTQHTRMTRYFPSIESFEWLHVFHRGRSEFWINSVRSNSC